MSLPEESIVDVEGSIYVGSIASCKLYDNMSYLKGI